MPALKTILDRFYRDYSFQERIAYDPIAFPRHYRSPADSEIAGFIASCFAYGKVDLFRPVVSGILSAMGSSPHAFLLGFSAKRHRRLFSGLSYRFNTEADITCLIYMLAKVLRKHGSIEALFKLYCSDGDTDIRNGLTGLVKGFLDVDTSIVYGDDVRPGGLLQFFPLPEKGSTCKRMNLFLRWMVRDRDIDLGLWKGIPKNKLVIPLDTHIARVSRCLGFTKRKSQDWKTAVEITESLKRLDPDDPLKYDFALCHQGIAGVCTAAKCAECRLFE